MQISTLTLPGACIEPAIATNKPLIGRWSGWEAGS